MPTTFVKILVSLLILAGVSVALYATYGSPPPIPSYDGSTSSSEEWQLDGPAPDLALLKTQEVIVRMKKEYADPKNNKYTNIVLACSGNSTQIRGDINGSPMLKNDQWPSYGNTCLPVNIWSWWDEFRDQIKAKLGTRDTNLLEVELKKIFPRP